MSMYRMVNGINPFFKVICDLIEVNFGEVERLRDCGVDLSRNIAWIYTRTGGGNRESYPNKVLTTHKRYIKDYDDEFDSTYAMYEFDINDIVNNESNYEILKLASEKPIPNWKDTFKKLDIDV